MNSLNSPTTSKLHPTDLLDHLLHQDDSDSLKPHIASSCVSVLSDSSQQNDLTRKEGITSFHSSKTSSRISTDNLNNPRKVSIFSNCTVSTIPQNTPNSFFTSLSENPFMSYPILMSRNKLSKENVALNNAFIMSSQSESVSMGRFNGNLYNENLSQLSCPNRSVRKFDFYELKTYGSRFEWKAKYIKNGQTEVIVGLSDGKEMLYGIDSKGICLNCNNEKENGTKCLEEIDSLDEVNIWFRYDPLKGELEYRTINQNGKMTNVYSMNGKEMEVATYSRGIMIEIN